jgi:translocation and assembly module TamA
VGVLAIFVRFSVVLAAPAFFVGTPVNAQAPKEEPTKTDAADPQEPIITDEEFNGAVPRLDDNPIESIDSWQKSENAKDQAEQQIKQSVSESSNPALRDGDVIETLPDAPVTDPMLDEPLPPIDSFDAEPPTQPVQSGEDAETKAVRYTFRLSGLDGEGDDTAAYRNARNRFYDLSALDDGDGKAENRSTVGARARADRQLLLDVLNGQGFYDAAADVSAEPPAAVGDPVTIVLTVKPGRRYYLGSIAFAGAQVEPSNLISSNFVPKTGDPIVAETILAAEANIAVKLPENGYPFAKVGQRDILLDGETGLGDYTLPVDAGARSYFGVVRTEGSTAFDAEHIGILRRFKTGELYDERLVDDLRAALVATGLLSTVSVQPEASAERAPDGTAYADLLVMQEAGPPRTLAASAGYGTGQGLRVEGSWTHRNLFPPEGSLTASAVAGTQEQSVALTFNRANAGRRDRNVELGLSALHSNYDAFNAFTGKLAGTIAYVSTPIWQKRLTYSYGFELLGTSEDEFDLLRGARDRRIYYVAALPGQIGFDTSNDLLNPTEGYRLNLRFSPEAALGAGSRIYVRALLDGSYYYSVNDSIVLAGRARLGSISGTSRGGLAPSRRYYGGGGGSVRGYAYQRLGPRDPNNDPLGGRSLNEAAVEARYRFGNFGIVGFVDAGQVYESSIPRFNDWRFGAGIGGRFYTNFGPVRLDVATPLNRQPGDSRISVYVSIGQAF